MGSEVLISVLRKGHKLIVRDRFPRRYYIISNLAETQSTNSIVDYIKIFHIRLSSNNSIQPRQAALGEFQKKMVRGSNPQP